MPTTVQFSDVSGVQRVASAAGRDEFRPAPGASAALFPKQCPKEHISFTSTRQAMYFFPGHCQP